MAGLLKAQFAFFVSVNFDPVFHKKIRLSNPAFQKESGSTFFPGLEEGISNGT
jgi:hypothetical protein